MEVSLNVDPEKLREESAIYKTLTPGCFLYEYRKALNDAAYELVVENPQLVQNKGELQALAKKKIDSDGYLYKRKKSRSADLSLNEPAPGPSKLTPSLRSKRISEIEEDLKEIKVEMTLIEKSRFKARNVDNDEKARRLTQEMTPLRERKRKLEDELTLLQKKEAKSILQKKKRDAKELIEDKGQLPTTSQIAIDKLLVAKRKSDLQQKDDIVDVNHTIEEKGMHSSTSVPQMDQSDSSQQKNIENSNFL